MTRAIAVGILVLLLLAVAAVFWLLHSGFGRDQALVRLQAMLPADTLQWERAEGSIAGPLRLHGVRYSHAGIEFSADEVLIDIDAGALLQETLHVQALDVRNARLTLPDDGGDDALPANIEWPGAPPPLQLPLSIVVDDAKVQGFELWRGSELQFDAETLQLAGTVRDGRIVVERLVLDADRAELQAHARIDTSNDWTTSLELVGAVRSEASEWPLRLTVDGDLGTMRIRLAETGEAGARLELDLQQLDAEPTWKARLHAPALDPTRLGIEGSPISIALRGSGDLIRADVEGELEYEGRRVRIEPSVLAYEDTTLALGMLRLQLDEAALTVRGEIGLAGPDAALDLAVSWRDLLLAAGEIPARSSGSANVQGVFADYALTFDAVVERGSQRAQLTGEGRGSETAVQLGTLRVDTGSGRLDASGHLAWTPELAWDAEATLSGFDPGVFLPEFEGAIDAGVVSSGGRDEEGLYGTLRLDPLDGSLRDRPVGGRLELELRRDGSGVVDADLRIGGSRIIGDGRWTQGLQARVELAPLVLSDLLPAAAGRLEGEVAVSGTQELPEFELDLAGADLRWNDFSAAALTLEGRLSQDAARLGARVQQLEISGQPFDSAELSLDGSRTAHRIELDLAGPVAAVRLHASATQDAEGWRGTVEAFEITPEGRGRWVLQSPASFDFGTASKGMRLERACVMQAPASFCVSADWSETDGTLDARLSDLPLATLDPFLAQAFGAPLSAYGSLTADLELRRLTPEVVEGKITVNSPNGGLRIDPTSGRDLLLYRDLDVDATIDAGGARLEARAGLASDGQATLRLQTGALQDPDAGLDGRIEAELRDLSFLELFSEDVAAPRGTLNAALDIGGSRAEPRISGRAMLRDFALELPALGIAPSDGELELVSDSAAGATIRGGITSGSGRLLIEGRLDARSDAEERVMLTVRGSDVVAADLPKLAASVSPDIDVRINQSRIRLRGSVGVAKARIDLERLESATGPSPDVVVVDAEAAPDAVLALDSEIAVELGDDVRLSGFGLDGRISGKLTVRDRPGRATLARGALDVRGEYTAYGQDMEITRGRLAYASTPLDNPALDVRAEREIDVVTVGVRVSGTAFRPELSLWSDPAMSQSEQLSYLVLGRPLGSASQADGEQLRQAAAAIGGNFLAQKMGARLGLDEVGVSNSSALGGAALTVGKYLSPKLYVSYGVALFGTGQVVSFKYLLSSVWSVQVDSGSENRAAINYRLER